MSLTSEAADETMCISLASKTCLAWKVPPAALAEFCHRHGCLLIRGGPGQPCRTRRSERQSGAQVSAELVLVM